MPEPNDGKILMKDMSNTTGEKNGRTQEMVEIYYKKVMRILEY